jgi:hypothetical protein
MNNQIEQRMNDGGYKTLTEQEVVDMRNKPSLLDRIKERLDKSPKVESSSFSYNKKKFQLDNSSKKK